MDSLVELGGKVTALYATAYDCSRVTAVVNASYVRDLAVAVTGRLGGQVGVAPRIFLKKLVADVLDRVEQFEDWDPRRDYALTLRPEELSDVERNVLAGASSASDIDLAL